MNVCKSVCKECPFRKDSLRGWLGPHRLEELMDAQQFESPFTCHMQRDGEKGPGEIDLCRGLFISASKSFKLMGQHPHHGEEMRRMQDETKKDDRENILTRNEFRNHHQQLQK